MRRTASARRGRRCTPREREEEAEETAAGSAWSRDKPPTQLRKMDDDTQLEWSNKLVKAAHLGDSEALRDFLSSGADPNSWGSCGAWVRGAYTFPRTALHVASQQLRLQCLYELLRSGADPHLRDQDGYTAAYYVCQKYIGDEEEGRVAARCLQLLFEFGASCRVITKGGAGLSELARRSGSQRCASLTEAEGDCHYVSLKCNNSVRVILNSF